MPDTLALSLELARTLRASLQLCVPSHVEDGEQVFADADESQIAALIDASIRPLVELIDRFASHGDDCMVSSKHHCTCGLDAACRAAGLPEF